MKHFNEQDIEKLKDISLTEKELAKELSCGTATITRWRKKLNCSPGGGSKKGKPKPWLRKHFNKCKICNVDLIGPKTYCSRECLHKDPEYIEKLKNVDKSYMQTEVYSNACRKKETPEYVRYKNKTHRLSEKTYKKYENEINPKGHKRGRNGVKNAYQLDHIISVREGFDRKLIPEFLSKKENLRIISWEENIKKGTKNIS